MRQQPLPDLGRIAGMFKVSPAPGEAADSPEGAGSEELPPLSDRRRAPRRRLRDRIASLDSTDNPALAATSALKDLAMLADDDLRETALALGGVEGYLAASLALLEKPNVTAVEIAAHAESEAVLDQLDALSDGLGNLRRRLAAIAAVMPRPAR